MMLLGARVALGPRRAVGRVVWVNCSHATLDLSRHMLLPGLINAHDHLEFNLFPQLGRGPYANATEWARDIYHPEASPIREHLRVPKPVRLWWGALKNLLSGVTTVCHHDPHEPEVFSSDFPVRVVRRFSWAHSLDFSPDLEERFRRAPKTAPFVVHCGEGTDHNAQSEVHKLDALGALDHRTAIVHGVALTEEGLALMRRRRAALIWCPTSNLTTLGRTVPLNVLQSRLSIALATDSALTAHVDLLDELRRARRYLGVERLYDMVTSEPARILRLPDSQLAADLIAVRSRSSQPACALFDGKVELVVVGGRIRLISPELALQLAPRTFARFQPLEVEGRPAVLVDADVRRLYRAAARHLGSDLRLAGKRVIV